MNKLRKLTETQVAAMVRLKELGMSYREIAQIFGVAAGTVRCHTQPGWKEKHRDRFRNKYVYVGREQVLTLVKRPRPNDGCCELCDRDCDGIGWRLYYHHWDDKDFSKGLWLCGPCHTLATLVEKGLSRRYAELKRNIEEQSANENNKRLGVQSE